MNKSLEVKVREALKKVMDPEIHVSLIDLGLIYKIKVKNEKEVKIIMTLTSIGCPLFPLIEATVKQAVKRVGFKVVNVELTFDPPWNLDMVAPEIRAMMGLSPQSNL